MQANSAITAITIMMSLHCWTVMWNSPKLGSKVTALVDCWTSGYAKHKARQIMCPSLPNVHALWLHPGYAITPMTLKNGQVHVNEGEGQGYYQTYENSGKQCVVIIFSGRQTTDFECQVPHNMRHLNRDVYRNYNNRQICIVLNSNNPVKVINSDVSTTSGQPDFHCVASFLYCHPWKREQSLRLG